MSKLIIEELMSSIRSRYKKLSVRNDTDYSCPIDNFIALNVSNSVCTVVLEFSDYKSTDRSLKQIHLELGDPELLTKIHSIIEKEFYAS